MAKYNPDNHAASEHVSHVSPTLLHVRINKGIYASASSQAALHIFLLQLPDFSSKRAKTNLKLTELIHCLLRQNSKFNPQPCSCK